MNIFKMDYISKTTTEIAKSYIENGFVFSNTMSGHQGELYKVDLYKDNKVVRIRVEEQRSRINKELRVICIYVEKFNVLNPYMRMHTLWNGKGEEILYLEYYIISRFSRDGEEVLTDDINEVKRIEELRYKRYYLKRVDYKNVFDNDKARKIALKFVNKQPKCKSIKLNDIKVEKRITKGNSTFRIIAKNKTFYFSK